MIKQCGICNETFFPYAVTAKYCSRKCSIKANNDARKEAKQKWYLNSVGRTEKLIRTSKERWIHCKSGYVLIKVNGELVYEHRVLAEKALGKPLPKGAVVHHTCAPDDNHGFLKLVICPDQDYHILLHTRMRIMGYANHIYR